jgi:hypothetical protein
VAEAVSGRIWMTLDNGKPSWHRRVLLISAEESARCCRIGDDRGLGWLIEVQPAAAAIASLAESPVENPHGKFR